MSMLDSTNLVDVQELLHVAKEIATLPRLDPRRKALLPHGGETNSRTRTVNVPLHLLVKLDAVLGLVEAQS